MDDEIPVIDDQLAGTQPAKRAARRNALTCPVCKSPMKAVYISKRSGGFGMIPNYHGCETCQKVYSITYNSV